MYKARLQEFCQQRHWPMPEYSATKHGLDHCPQFNASVIVNGFSFTTDSLYKSSKEAQNIVAQIAIQHFLQSPGTSTDNNSRHKTPEANQTAGTSPVVKNDRIKELQQMYKNHLQVYAQKRNLALPEYSTEREGPPHACRFKSKVTVYGQTYETTDFFPTLKEAENAAAKVAISSLLPEGVHEDNSGFYKNLLQELAQKGGHLLPTYSTERTGNFHAPTFTSTVELGGRVFVGMGAKNKKQAEMNAAKVAYMKLTEGESRNSAASTHELPMSYSSTVENLQSFPQPSSEFVPPQSPPFVKQAPQISISIVKQELQAEEQQQHLNNNNNNNDDDESQQQQAVEVTGNMNTSNPVSPVSSLSNNNNIHYANHDDREGGGSMPNSQTEAGHEYHERVLVRPRLPNMTLPPTAVVNFSDDGKWVAIRVKDPTDGDIAMMFGGLK